MPIDLRVHPRVGHSENNTASPPRHRESPIIHIQKRHHNKSSGDCPSGDGDGDDDNHANDSDTDSNCSLPLLHRDNSNSNNRIPKIGHGVGGKKRKFILHYIISLLLLFAYRFISGSVMFYQHPSTTSPDATIYGLPSNATNPFIARYEQALLNKKLGSDLFVPLLYENGKLLCRRNHKSQLSRYRTRYFAQMVRTGLVVASKGTKQQQRKQHLHDNDGTNDNTTSFHITTTLNNYDDGLPMLVMDGDDNGCNIQQHIDTYNFPRLTWSDLSLKHTTKTDTIHNRTTTTTNHHEHPQSSSCNTISMPSYETYKYYHRSHRTYRDWEHTFATYAHNYPFTTKIPKAVWRGSTTYEGSQYTGSELQDTPRGRLVLIGKERDDIMDVGFHKILQQYAEEREELSKRFTMKRRMHPMDMMRYRAIIDIDGNNWSSRFGMLLCSNSIVIKIEPDFIEYFYGENGTVQPNIHYLPASLENITQVVSYAMDTKNDKQMKDMIRSANDWCKHSLSEEGLAHDALLRLDAYANALDSYRNGSWRTEWKVVKKRFIDTIDDFVDCNAWSVVDWFTFPMFAGL